jgi:hypothetical protein
VAKDLKQNKQAPAISATQMTDSQMDKVTAGGQGGLGHGYGGGEGLGNPLNLHGNNGNGQGALNNNPHGRF